MKVRHLLRPLLLAAVLLALASGCATTDFVTGKPVKNIYSLDEEVQMGGQYYTEMIGELKKEKAPIDQHPGHVFFVAALFWISMLPC